MKYLNSIFILCFFLVSQNVYANESLLLSVESFNSLSGLQKRSYILDLRKLQVEFENQLNQDNIIMSSFFNMLLFFPADAHADGEQCLVGGQLLNKIGNKCSVKLNTCNGPRSFQCGEIFGKFCLKNANIKTISKECYQQSNKQKKFSNIDYQKIKTSYEKILNSICQNSTSDGCIFLKRKIEDINKKFEAVPEIIAPPVVEGKSLPVLKVEKTIQENIQETIKNAIIQASNAIVDLKNNNDQTPGSSQRAFCSECNLENNVVATNPCELEIGDHKIVATQEDSGLRSAYRLIKLSPTEYRAEVNLQLKRVPAIPDEKRNEYNTIIEKCYEHGTDFLKGPGGKKIKLSLTDNPSVPPSEIQLVSIPDHRSTSVDWNISILDKINCATIIHETLHLLGLVDLYQEKLIGLHVSHGAEEAASTSSLAYQCRVVAKSAAAESLIMKNSASAYTCAMGAEQYKVNYCECTDQQQCADHKMINPNLCTGTTYSVTIDLPNDLLGNTEILEDKIMNEFKAGSKATHPGKKVHLFKIEKMAKIPKSCSTVLSPAEFQFITVPRCSENQNNNKNYLSCGANAYYPSKDNPGPQCKPMESICKGENDQWLR